jgi:putative phosphoribosyl transferase
LNRSYASRDEITVQIYPNRQSAGKQLAAALESHAKENPVVVGLPRGGVPVAFEVARHLRAPLDVFVVRKLGVPWQPELAMGAIASGGVLVRNEDVLRLLGGADQALARVEHEERLELKRRETLYRGSRPAVPIRDREVIVVDDGLATGATMKAAVLALRQAGAARVVVAVPVGPPDTCTELEELADQVVCLQRPIHFMAVGQWYEEFGQTTDREVQELLQAGPEPRSGRRFDARSE